MSFFKLVNKPYRNKAKKREDSNILINQMMKDIIEKKWA